MSDATTIDAGFTPSLDERRAYLVVREGEKTQVIDLDEGAEISFGRSPEATVRLDDGKASREHARIVCKNGLSLIDLGSRNGTRLNDDVVRNTTRGLRSGDVVRIGDVEILVAETAGSSRGGGRLQAELARRDKATVIRLPAGTDLQPLQSLLAGAILVEKQASGEYACLFEEVDLAALEKKIPALTVHNTRAPSLPSGVVVADPEMVRVFELVRKVSAAPTTVLILGETGAGKEVIAEQIHRQSPRKDGPFVRLNCGSLPETLLESELFGHEKGAFTGADRKKIGHLEAAHGGTLFLDEIGELALPMQAKLLRVLEDHRFLRVGGRDEIAVDLRVVAATNRDLQDESRFREDLYFRLSAFVIELPPLRERTGEIILLAELFARQFAKRMNTHVEIAPRAAEALRRHSWPGNVRELRNAMERAVVLAENGVVDVAQLPDAIRLGKSPSAGGPMKEQLADLEKKSILDALDAEKGNQTRAARRLGISRRALLYKLEKYGIK
jgi:DNA-binding NtrC family response regulator